VSDEHKRRFILWPERPEIRAGAISAVRDASTEVPIEVTLKRYRKSKTDEQRAYVWAVIYPCLRQHILDTTGQAYTNDDVHDNMTRRFAAPVVTRFNGETTETFKSLGKMNVKECAEYIDKVLSCAAAEWNCYVPEPNKNWKGPPIR
jgi:hypothetical protein